MQDGSGYITRYDLERALGGDPRSQHRLLDDVNFETATTGSWNGVWVADRYRQLSTYEP